MNNHDCLSLWCQSNLGVNQRAWPVHIHTHTSRCTTPSKLSGNQETLGSLAIPSCSPLSKTLFLSFLDIGLLLKVFFFQTCLCCVCLFLKSRPPLFVWLLLVLLSTFSCPVPHYFLLILTLHHCSPNSFCHHLFPYSLSSSALDL